MPSARRASKSFWGLQHCISAFLKVIIFFSASLTRTPSPVCNLHWGNAVMQNGLHPFHTIENHCVLDGPVTWTQALSHTALTESWGCQRFYCRLGTHVSRAPAPLALCSRGRDFGSYKRYHPFSGLCNKSRTMVVASALRVRISSLAELLETARDSDEQSKGLMETAAKQGMWTDGKLPGVTFCMSSGWLKEWVPPSCLCKASKSVVYRYVEILLCTIKMQPALHKAKLSFNGIHQYYKRQKLKWIWFLTKIITILNKETFQSTKRTG